jgi:predicted component of type VI protein secretion system
MPAQLISLNDGPNILLDKPILLIGRHEECDIQIDSRKISRRHCCIAQVNDYLVVRDLGSTNGIRINGVRVLEGRLNHNDELTIGANRYRLTWDVLEDEAAEPEQELRRQPHTQRSGKPVDPDDDDALESCDEPIPLADPQARLAHKPGAAPLGTIAHPERDPRDSPVPPPGERPQSRLISDNLIIPENLNLAPSSDIDLKSPNPSS